MSFFYTWRILHILLATIVTVATQEVDSQEVSAGTKSPALFPVVLPVSYRVQDADFLFLKEAGQDIMGNSSMQTHTQPLVILRAGRLPVISATYGPLSAERPVPPDLLRPAPLFGAAGARGWKVQSFVLTPRVESSAPAVRVLFYVAGRDWDGGAEPAREPLPCVTVYAFWQTQEVRGSCAMGGPRGTCMAVLAPAAGWFSPGAGGSSRERPDPAEGNTVELYYQARPGADGRCTFGDGGRWGSSGQQSRAEYAAVTPMLRIGSVRLLQAPKGTSSLSRLKLGNAIVIQTSSKPLKKTDIASFYILMSSSSSVENFTLRAAVKTGVSFRTATPSNALLWDIALDKGADGAIAVVCQRKSDIPGKKLGSSWMEVLQMDFEVEELSSALDSQAVSWRLELPPGAGDGGRMEGAMRIYTTPRDFVGLAPLVMDTEILNTAVLTGKKVVMPVRTVAVEEDGLVTDVSDFTDCNSTDEDVLKVSDRCDYVFVNGKETKGKVKMKVTFTYSYLSAQLEMDVWIPRLPLQIEVSDAELSQIKGWRVPITVAKSPRLGWISEEEGDRKGKGCMLQFQHAVVRVLADFTAERADPRDPRASLLGSDWQVDVTRLVRYFLKVEDPLVARLHAGRVLSGRDVGTTSVQVFSPLSDSILAEKMVTVVDDKVTITELGVQLVSGLSLSLQLSPGSNRAILATATTQDVLQSPKQEAVVSAWVQFSDGSLTPLDIYDPNYYRVTVTSLDEGVVSVRGTPPAVVAVGEGQGVLVRVEMAICEACQKSKRKSTLAVGGGSLKVKFQVNGRRFDGGGGDSGGDYGSDGDEADGERKRRRRPPGQTAPADSASEREESAMRRVSTTARSAVPGETGPGGAGGATGNSLGAGYRAGGSDGGTAKAPGNLLNYDGVPAQVEVDLGGGEDVAIVRPLTDLEIGMYALLGVFCLAILVFLVNCISYVVKFRRKRLPSHGSQEPGGHRHDWVWLGTDAELVMDVPGGPAFDGGAATVMDIGQEKAAPLPLRRTSCLAFAADSIPALRNKLVRSESLRSPTTKRKRVQFTTFGSLDRRQRSPGPAPEENGHGIRWVGQEEEEGGGGDVEAGASVAAPEDRFL